MRVKINLRTSTAHKATLDPVFASAWVFGVSRVWELIGHKNRRCGWTDSWVSGASDSSDRRSAISREVAEGASACLWCRRTAMHTVGFKHKRGNKKLLDTKLQHAVEKSFKENKVDFTIQLFKEQSQWLQCVLFLCTYLCFKELLLMNFLNVKNDRLWWMCVITWAAGTWRQTSEETSERSQVESEHGPLMTEAGNMKTETCWRNDSKPGTSSKRWSFIASPPPSE